MFKVFTSFDVLGQITVKLCLSMEGTGLIVKVVITQEFTLKVFETCDYLINAYSIPRYLTTKLFVIYFDC